MRVINTVTQKYREKKSIPAGENQARHLSLTLKTILHLDFQRLVKKSPVELVSKGTEARKHGMSICFCVKNPPVSLLQIHFISVQRKEIKRKSTKKQTNRNRLQEVKISFVVLYFF